MGRVIGTGGKGGPPTGASLSVEELATLGDGGGDAKQEQEQWCSP